MIRLKEFSSRGEDTNIKDQNDGGLMPIEVRFDVGDVPEYYPGDTDMCGQGSEGSVMFTDVKHYCVVLFGNTMVTSDSQFVVIPSPASEKTIHNYVRI
jgi:hypothetical protein